LTFYDKQHSIPSTRRKMGIYPALSMCFVVVLLVGCGYSNYQAATSFDAQAGNITTPTPKFQPPMIDCIWSRKLQAFTDGNRNKVWDRGELPLAGVAFYVDDIHNHYTDVGGEAISDNQGKAAVGVGLPGCPQVDFEVYAQPPKGYIFTTPERVHVILGEDDPLLFGFAPVRYLPEGPFLPGIPDTGRPAQSKDETP
jgi:hypothetical protein